ncbi:unnamed protein product, partial [Rotaria sp. Silwood2]
MADNVENQLAFPQNDLSSTVQSEIVEDFVIVWLSDYHISNNFMEISSALRVIIDNLQLFDNADNCIDYITSLSSNINKLIILSSHQFIIPLINEIPQIKSIYIFNMNDANNNNSYSEHIHLGNIFNNKQLLVDKIKRDVKLLSMHFPLPMAFFDDKNQSVTQKSVKNLSKESKYFMYMNLFIEILLHPSENNEAKSDFLSVCREHYSNNNAQKSLIDSFEKDYTPDNAIQWYIRDCFVYRIVNEALRCQKFYNIYKLRLIINDLYQQLKNLYLKQSSELKYIETVYRGQLVNKNEFEILRQIKGGLVSMNSFMSTTLDKAVAFEFIAGAIVGDSVPVIFEINLKNTGSISIPFAYIKDFGKFKAEEEVLFS